MKSLGQEMYVKTNLRECGIELPGKDLEIIKKE